MKTAVLFRQPDRTTTVIGGAIGCIALAAILMVAFDSPIPILGAMLVLAGVIAVVRFPIAGLVALLFFLPFHYAIIVALGNRAHVGVGPLVYWKDAAVAALFARALFERWRKDGRLPVFNAGDNVLMFYVLALAVLAFVSPARPTVGPSLGRYIEGPIIFLTIRFLRPTRRELWWCAGAVLAAATVIAAAAVIEALGPKLAFQHWYGVKTNAAGDPFFLGRNQGYRAGSFLMSPFILSFVMAGAVPFAWALALLRSRGRAVAVACAVASSGGLVAAATRSGYIGGLVGILIVILFAVRNPVIRVSLLSIVIVIVTSGTMYYADKGSSVLVRPASNAAHQDRLQHDFDLIASRPFGYGLGSADTPRSRADAGLGQLGYTESTFMAKALETGVHGLMLYLLAAFVTGMRLRSVRLRARRGGDAEGVAIVAGAIGAMLGVNLAGMFLGVHELVIEEVLWALPGIALAWPIMVREPKVSLSLE